MRPLKYFLSICTLLFTCGLLAQIKAPDIMATDTDGKVHNLYEDYLDEGKIVVVHLFFVNCPPCNFIAMKVQKTYKKYGEGKKNLQFLEFTTMGGDTDQEIKGYKSQHGITFPSFGFSGGAGDVVEDYIDKDVGSYSGTPHFTLIKPDGTYVYDIVYDILEEEIEKALAEIEVAKTNTITIDYALVGNSFPEQSKFYLRSSTDTAYNREIVSDTTDVVRFKYPSENYPSTQSPFITFKSLAPINPSKIDVIDLVAVRRHILRLKMLEGVGLTTADVTNDGKIDVGDIVEMRKVILRLQNSWASGVSNYIMIPSKLEIVVDDDGDKKIDFSPVIAIMGNVVE